MFCGHYLPRFTGDENQGELEMSTKVQKNEQQQQNNERKFPQPKAWALNWDRRALSEEQRNEQTPKTKSSR